MEVLSMLVPEFWLTLHGVHMSEFVSILVSSSCCQGHSIDAVVATCHSSCHFLESQINFVRDGALCLAAVTLIGLMQWHLQSLPEDAIVIGCLGLEPWPTSTF